MQSMEGREYLKLGREGGGTPAVAYVRCTGLALARSASG